jgi:hypothetical protein
MPTTLSLFYTAVVEVSVPNAVARKLMDGQDGVDGDLFYTRYGNLIYKNDAGGEVEIEGKPHEVDYKRTSDGTWGDEEESEDESEEENEEKGGCGDCHGDTGAEMTTDGSGLCIECRKGADLGEEEAEDDD